MPVLRFRMGRGRLYGFVLMQTFRERKTRWTGKYWPEANGSPQATQYPCGCQAMHRQAASRMRLLAH